MKIQYGEASPRKWELPQLYSRLSPRERRGVREQYIEEQHGLCMYCQGKLSGPPTKEVLAKKIRWGLFPSGFRDHPIHLQHNHDTDETEGAVHAVCNAVLWQYEGR